MTREERERLWMEAYTTHINAVRDLLRRQESDWDVVDDLTQETFTQAWASLDDYHGQSAFTTWVVGIARNVLGHYLERMTAAKRQGEVLEHRVDPQYPDFTEDQGQGDVPYYDRVDLSEYLAQGTSALDPALIAESEDTYAHVTGAMSADMAAAVHLRAQGLTNPEIAEALGVQPGTVAVWINRASKNFQDACNNPEENRTKTILASETRSLPRDRFATQADVERACRDRFLSRDLAIKMRKIREAHPNCTLAEWRELYEREG